MRKDEEGNECPETLGEYFDICKSMFGEDSSATKLMSKKIDKSPNGREEKVVISDYQMRYLLFNLVKGDIDNGDV